MTASGCCGAAAGAAWNDIRRCGRRCSGPISSSPAQERALFDRLAVFAGGFDLDSAEAVCADDTLDPLDVGDLLAALVDKSMVVADRHGPRTRYRLLETLRQYGEERLAEDGELAALRDRHLDHYVATARRASRQAEGTGYADGMNTLEAEWDNFRAALQWASTTGDAARAGELLGALHFFATIRLRFELGEWAEQILELGGAGAGGLRGRRVVRLAGRRPTTSTATRPDRAGRPDGVHSEGGPPLPLRRSRGPTGSPVTSRKAGRPSTPGTPWPTRPRTPPMPSSPHCSLRRSR